MVISLVSLGWSVHVGHRDRAKLRAFSKFYPAREEYRSGPHLVVKAVNHGRRSINLTMFGMNYPNGDWIGTHLDSKNRGLMLKENEYYEETIRITDDDLINREGETATDLWFEDSMGNRYKVKKAKKHLNQLFGR